jgi:pimeloyl-ACP methyl ester carboxylesterase
MQFENALNIHVLDRKGVPIPGAIVTVYDGTQPVAQGRSRGYVNAPLKLRFNVESASIRIGASYNDYTIDQTVPATERDVTITFAEVVLPDVPTRPEEPVVAKPHVVILVHGIRDFALWQTTIRSTLEDAGFKTEATNYGRFNLVEFLAPISFFRRKAIEAVWNQIRIIKQNNEGALLSIIAHSFGTYVIAHLMQQKFDVKFHRVIFCGSVVRYSFPFEQFQDRFSGPIVNEVGTRDIWPAMAESMTTGYGSAGTYGFNRPLVRDRWHNGARHGFFLDADFCKKFWIPSLTNGSVIPGSIAPERPRFWIQLISIIKIKYVVVVVLLLFLIHIARAI